MYLPGNCALVIIWLEMQLGKDSVAGDVIEVREIAVKAEVIQLNELVEEQAKQS
jgi:hypothetical protein